MGKYINLNQFKVIIYRYLCLFLALIFTSGGGRLGNQILNLIHLVAFSIEYKTNIFKVNDSFLISKDKSIFFKVEKNYINWKINLDSSTNFLLSELFLKVFIRCLHFYYHISPFGKSYKIGSKSNYPNFIFGKNLKYGFSIKNLIKESEFSNVVISGWGLRDWELVKKHKNKIVGCISEGIKKFIKKKPLHFNNYLLVHIRRSDFLEVDNYKDLNFNNQIWIESITKLCKKKSIKDVVIFSDSNITNEFVNKLKNRELNVFIPDAKDNANFLDLFINYVFHASIVICNSSTIVLSISFLSHEKVYLPSRQKDYQEVCINNAHLSFPTLLNWN